ncbi:MAG: SpoIIE family protein phosphatase, partial [Spirochaetota bacterium]
TNVSRVSEIIYSTEIIDEKLNNKTIQKLIISAGAIALSILITFIVSSFISKPIHQIVEDVDHISAGNVDHKTSVNANNELKILEQSINLMVNNMKQYIDKITDSEEKIKEYNEHLEDMVEQRTSELNKVNKELKQINRAMLEELKMAQRVQESIIPNVKNLPHIGRLNYGSDYTAMENIGGDLYDVIRVGRNSCGLLMADVSGHGVPAALITTMAKVSFNSNSRWGLTTGEICNSINDELYDFIGDLEYYLTAYYGIIDLETGIFNYTNCGHHPAILYRKRTGEFIKLDTDGFFIGAFSKVEYETGEVQLEEGDRILLFTDGIIEARNENKEFYEYERLMKYLNDNSHLPTDVFVDNLIADVNEFCGDEPADDDRAVLYVEFVSKVHKGKSSGIDKSLKIDAKIEKEDKTSSTKHTIEGESKYNNKEFKELYNNSLDYLRNNKYEQALNVLIHLKDIKSDDIGVLNNLSICYYKLGRLEEASDILKYAMEIDENNEKIKKNKRIIDRKLNND